MEKVAAVDGALDALPPDASLSADALDGVKSDEAVVVVKSGARASPLFGDAMMNLPHLAGADGLLFRLIGSTGGPRVTWLAKVTMVSDKNALRAHLLRLADQPGLVRLVPSHGRVVEHDAEAVLRNVAAGI